MELNKIEENVYEIPKTGDMEQPAKVYASEKLLDEMKEDRALEQIRNVASLPGIEKHAVLMPDGHQGYGFPIGGVAAVDAEEGFISPGGIGFDINCLTGESEVLLEFGRKSEIKNLRERFESEKAVVSAGEESIESNIQLFTEKEDREVYQVETETGETIKATEDHPFLTQSGMKPLSELGEGERVFIRQFKGVADEQPEEFTILEESDLEENDQLINALNERNLLPLKSTDREFNILLKLIGFHTGDGSFNNHGDTSFYADKEDLETIREDIKDLGFKPSKIYSRDRSHQVRKDPFEVTETSVKSTSKAFQKLMTALGAPKGEKTQQSFALPSYFDRLSRWQKALYLSSFFGAEMSTPSSQTKKNMYCPKISQNKSVEVKESGEKFMREVKKSLNELGINTNSIEEFETHENRNGRVMRYRLGIKNDSENLIKFFQKIGYRYNKKKQKKAVKSVQYLKAKQKAIQRREDIAKESLSLYNSGMAPKNIKSRFDINKRFIERSIYSGRTSSSRPLKEFPDYEDYIEDLEVRDDLTVKTVIKNIQKSGREKVYDIGVAHEEHNFQASQFIVSNCGVRLVKTDLKYQDIQGKEEQLVNILYNQVPCGLGGGSYIETDKEDLMEIMEKGIDWMIENGHATEEDKERCEENGRLPGKPEKVPEDAIKRGLNQVGSLGSGNHFLEVQRVGEVYQDVYDLEKDQIVVMIHSGSRGLGHQTCTDYLRKFEKEYPEIAENIPEKNLMYGPLNEQLGQDYRDAMYAAANYAWANRQGITEAVREALDKLFDDVETELLYDVCHNIAKEETHEVDGEDKELLVHRKGATRAFPKSRKEVPEIYEDIGQPVLLPGSMGTSSYVLVGGESSLQRSFGSTAHGAGRLKSRNQAKEDHSADRLQRDLENKGIYVKARSGETVAEEAPDAYKDIDEVIRVSDELDIGSKAAKLLPVVNIKG